LIVCDTGCVVIAGAAEAFTVNVCAPLVPAGVITVTLPAPGVAFAAIVKVAVIVVLFTTAKLLPDSPVPLYATAAPATKFVPVSVTGNAVP
jgi:hypothetical protein